MRRSKPSCDPEGNPVDKIDWLDAVSREALRREKEGDEATIGGMSPIQVLSLCSLYVSARKSLEKRASDLGLKHFGATVEDGAEELRLHTEELELLPLETRRELASFAFNQTQTINMLEPEIEELERATLRGTRFEDVSTDRWDMIEGKA